jgi:hypothetical protein
MTSEMRFYTDAWYSDREVTFVAPAHWDVTTHWPDTLRLLRTLRLSNRSIIQSDSRRYGNSVSEKCAP